MLTAWLCLALCLLRLNGCDAQGIKDGIAKHTYDEVECKAWWQGWHAFSTKNNPYSVSTQNDLWESYYNGVSARVFATGVGVLAMFALLVVAINVPLQRKKFIHDWQI